MTPFFVNFDDRNHQKPGRISLQMFEMTEAFCTIVSHFFSASAVAGLTFFGVLHGEELHLQTR